MFVGGHIFSWIKILIIPGLFSRLLTSCCRTLPWESESESRWSACGSVNEVACRNFPLSNQSGLQSTFLTLIIPLILILSQRSEHWQFCSSDARAKIQQTAQDSKGSVVTSRTSHSTLCGHFWIVRVYLNEGFAHQGLAPPSLKSWRRWARKARNC